MSVSFSSSAAAGGIAIFVFVLNLLIKQTHGEIVSPFKIGGIRRKGCDIFQGRWIYDTTYPLYNATDCPFIEQPFTCQKNGRPDTFFLKYRWQPTACNLPRLNGMELLGRIKGKRIMFVGDSLSLNQWQSLICMLHAALPTAKYYIQRNQDLSTFRLPAYNVTVLFRRDAFFVDISRQKNGRVLKLDSITDGGLKWKGVDTLIFNTWHWWLHTGQQQPWDYIQVANKTYKDMNRLSAFEIGLSTWARWVDSNLSPKTTKVFFQGVSPDHGNATAWGVKTKRDCRGEELPISGSRYPGRPNQAEIVVEKVIQKMTTPVYLLNITLMSQLRKDGHPSIYGFGGVRGSDCSHWCLPGVPDAWNQLLYIALIQN